ncbi:type VII secretion target [Plantactinospora siamensis]|uniref:Type VII secretion target n=1 Tax=Plantactinospora siamensis TaxID=555372 RepID=A0ABV6NVM6_9ACTN
MDSLHTVSRRLAEEADRLAEAAAELRSGAGIPPAALAGGVPGRLGTLGRDLQAHWAAAVDARAREAAAAAEELTGTAAAVRKAASGYADTDHAARQRHAGEW